METNSNKIRESMISKGMRLKECRTENGLSQADIAEILISCSCFSPLFNTPHGSKKTAFESIFSSAVKTKAKFALLSGGNSHSLNLV